MDIVAILLKMQSNEIKPKKYDCNIIPNVFSYLVKIIRNMQAEKKQRTVRTDEKNKKSAETYYKYVYSPKKEAEEMARKHQEKLDRMVRHGEVVSVEPERITVKVEDGGGDIGEIIAVRTNEFTSVQVGMRFVNEPGIKTDLTQWFKTGDYVNMLVKDGQALALHRELRPGEQQKEEITENMPEQH